MTRSLCIKRPEAPLGGVRRILHSELDGIREALAHSPIEPPPELVHELRVRIKRVRAQLRVLRRVVDRSCWQTLDQGFRRLAQHLAPSRESAVLTATLNEVALDAGVPPALAEHLRRQLGFDREPLHPNVQSLKAETDVLASDFAPGGALDVEAQPFVAGPSWQRKTFLRALRRMYRSGRHKLNAIETMTERDVALHEFRKDVKYHAHQLLLLPSDPRLRRRVERLARLGSLLGTHHDLSELEQRVVANSTPGESSALLPELIRRKARIERKALRLAARLYARKPRRFSRWLSEHTHVA